MSVEVKDPVRRAMLAAGVTFVAYTVSVAPHEGEFWPFSIFPMFSRAGKPWTRALVLDLAPNEGVADPSGERADNSGRDTWGPWSMDNLPGRPFSTRAAQVSTNDLSKFIQLTNTWTHERKEALLKLFEAPLNEGRHLLLLRVRGTPTAEGGVEIALTGLVRMSSQGLVVNPALT